MVIIPGQEIMRSPRRLVSRKRHSYKCIGDHVRVYISVHYLSTAPLYSSYHHMLLGYSVQRTLLCTSTEISSKAPVTTQMCVYRPTQTRT